jgi:hypothetical protein
MAEQTVATHNNTFIVRPNRLGGCYILRYVIACIIPMFVSIYTVIFDRNFSGGIAAIAAGGKR